MTLRFYKAQRSERCVLLDDVAFAKNATSLVRGRIKNDPQRSKPRKRNVHVAFYRNATSFVRKKHVHVIMRTPSAYIRP